MAARLAGLRSSLKLDWLTVLARPSPAPIVCGFLASNAMLGGIYSLLFKRFVLSPLSDPSRLSGLLPVNPARSLDSTPSTIVFLTPFFISSFFKSALAASVTPGPEKSSTIESRAHSRTCGSVSSRQSTNKDRYGLMGNK